MFIKKLKGDRTERKPNPSGSCLGSLAAVERECYLGTMTHLKLSTPSWAVSLSLSASLCCQK